MKKGRGRGVLVNVALFFLSLVVAFAAGEAAFRAYGLAKNIDFRLYAKELHNPDRLPEEMFVNDDLLVKRLRPSAQVIATTSDFSVVYSINSKGLRDREYPYEKPEGVIRILAFGDSGTFGEGIPYGRRFADIPEEALENVEILDFGVPGYGLDQSFLQFVEEGRKYEADHVFLFMTNTNAARNWTGERWKSGTGKKGASPGTIYLAREDPFFNETLSSSHLLSYLRYHVDLLLLKREFERFDKALWEDIDAKSNVSRLGGEELRKRVRSIVGEFEDASEEAGMRFSVIKIDQSREAYGLNETKGFSFYHLRGPLIELSKRQSLSFTYDRHYNADTHRVIGEELTKIIANMTSS